MFKKLMTWLGRCRIINDRKTGEPYLERYYLFLKDRKNFPFNIFLHKFVKSDPDHLHDHPWGYTTFILKGGYHEWVPIIVPETGAVVGSTREWRGPGSLIKATADSMHRVELEPGITPWTIFIPGKKSKDWGFIHPKKVDEMFGDFKTKTVKYVWTDHKTYLGEDNI